MPAIVHYSQDISQCLTGKIGAAGLPEAAFGAVLGACGPALDKIRAWHQDGALPLLQLPAARADLARLAPLATTARERLSDIVVLGTGGSSLGGKTLMALSDDQLFGTVGERPHMPRMHFVDNVDPHSFEGLLARLDLHRTLFLVISKSGGTAETISQFLIALATVRARLGDAQIAPRFTVITEPNDNPLRRMAARWRFTVLDHDPGVGGRFSVLSLVGLLPAMIAGIDVVKVRAGAQAVLDHTLAATAPSDCEPARGAAMSVGLMRERGITTTVLMPYCDRLAEFGMWYRQLWAESIGKNADSTTPIRAMGTVDQHSQLQLYLAGRADKMYTLIGVGSVGAGAPIDDDLADDPALAYLHGRTMGDLLDAEYRATAEALARNGRPVRRIHLSALTPESLGALLMHFMLETIIAAQLIGVDAFNQPAVEQGKVLAREYLAHMASDGSASAS